LANQGKIEMPAPKFARLMSSAGLQSQELGEARRGSVVDMTADDVRRELVAAFKVKIILCNKFRSSFSDFLTRILQQRTDADGSGFLDRTELTQMMVALKITFKDAEQDIDSIFGKKFGQVGSTPH
jgi:hypothetical protein